MKAMMTSPAARVRGIFLRCRKSTGGCRRSCKRSERKMMKARSGKNQKAESMSVKAIARMMDVRYVVKCMVQAPFFFFLLL